LKLENPLMVQRIQIDSDRQQRSDYASNTNGRGEGRNSDRGTRSRGDKEEMSGRGGRGMISNRGPAANASNVRSVDGDLGE
jgi:hypothetical protein